MLRAGAAAREAHGISEGIFYKMKKQGITPREMKVGTRTPITFEAAADWQREREAASVAEPGPRPRSRRHSGPCPDLPLANSVANDPNPKLSSPSPGAFILTH